MCLPLMHLETCRLEKGEHLGFEYEIVHNGRGIRCGYVRVLPGHPWYEVFEPSARVHGGITFAEHGKACPTHGEKDEWWVGFDCGHAFDGRDFSLPWSDVFTKEHWPHVFDTLEIRDTDYVRTECISLCEQAAEAMR